MIYCLACGHPGRPRGYPRRCESSPLCTAEENMSDRTSDSTAK